MSNSRNLVPMLDDVVTITLLLSMIDAESAAGHNWRLTLPLNSSNLEVDYFPGEDINLSFIEDVKFYGPEGVSVQLLADDELPTGSFPDDIRETVRNTVQLLVKVEADVTEFTENKLVIYAFRAAPESPVSYSEFPTITVNSTSLSNSTPFTVQNKTGSTIISTLWELEEGNIELLAGQPGSYYLNRSNHTGTQARSTITGLNTLLAQKLVAALNLSDLTDVAAARNNMGIGEGSDVEFLSLLFNMATEDRTLIEASGTIDTFYLRYDNSSKFYLLEKYDDANTYPDGGIAISMKGMDDVSHVVFKVNGSGQIDIADFILVGPGTDSTFNVLQAYTASAAINRPTLRYEDSRGNWQLSNGYERFFDLTDAYEIEIHHEGTFSSSEVILRKVTAREFSLPVALLGSQSFAQTPALSNSTFVIKKNGTTIGTIFFGAGSTSAVFSFAAGITFGLGDLLTITAPAIPDTNLSKVAINILGNI